jgi:hypothetical protein
LVQQQPIGGFCLEVREIILEVFEEYFEKLPSWIRWILFLPLSIIVYVLSNFLTNIGGVLMNFLSLHPMSDKLFTHIISPAVAGYLAVAFAFAMVPAKKIIVFLIITGIWMIVYGAVVAFALLVNDWRSAIPGIVSAVTATFCYMYYKEQLTSSTFISSLPEVE